MTDEEAFVRAWLDDLEIRLERSLEAAYNYADEGDMLFHANRGVDKLKALSEFRRLVLDDTN
jgi:hypothetical protein